MAWFIGRSVVVIVLAFLLGLLVGWLWWRRRKVHFGESQAIAKVTAAQQTRVDELSAKLARAEAQLRHRTEELDARRADLVDRDDEIARLRATAITAPATAVVDLTDAAAGADGVPGSEGTPAGRGLVDVSSGSATWSAEPPAPASAPASGATTAAPVAFVSAPTEPAPEVLESLATDVDEISTAGHEVPAESVAAAEAAVEPVAAGAIPAQATAEPVAAESVAAEPVVAPVVEPVVASAATAAVPEAAQEAAHEGADGGDDLERIEGIGPRIGAALRGAGIHTFSQLADADTSTLQGALEQAGLRFAPSLPTWSRQARLLADGDEAGFLALTQQLVGGRDVPGTK